MRSRPEHDGEQDVRYGHAPRRKARPDHFDVYYWTFYPGGVRKRVYYVYARCKGPLKDWRPADYDALREDLPGLLRAWADAHPETAEWPLRFASGPSEDVGRTVIQ
jgi:hypothetical protein